MKRVRSMGSLPPSMSELRVALLGRGPDKRAVMTLLLPKTKPKDVASGFQKLCEGNLVLINTPDLHTNNMTTNSSYDDFIKEFVKVSDPGPHVFLLVLQPDDFTEQQEQMFCRVLKQFNEKSFDHVIILISTPRDEKTMENPSWKKMIRTCRYRYMNMKHLEPSELLTRLGQIAKENNEEHVSHEAFEDPRESFSDDQTSRFDKGPSGAVKGLFGMRKKPNTGDVSSKEFMSPKNLPVFVLLGGKKPDQKQLSEFITGIEANIKTVTTSEIRGEPVTILGSKDGADLSWLEPGPKVFLLLIEPKTFSLVQRLKLQRTLESTGRICFPNSIVVFTKDAKRSKEAEQLIQDCGGRCSTMKNNDRKNFKDLIEKTLLVPQQTIRQLNLIFSGRNEPRSSAVKTILGLQPVSSSEAVKHQTSVFGYNLSISELSDMCGKPQDQARRESLQHICQYDPEGVHAFVIVQPVAPLTDEDKREFKMLLDTFGSRVSDFTVMLFTVESNISAQNVDGFLKESKELQHLITSCGGRYNIMNINTNQQVHELLRTVDEMGKREDKPCLYTTNMFVQTQIEKIAALERLTSPDVTSIEEKKTPTCLRIVLFGRTGNGKSSSANTIVGTKELQAESSPTSVTKTCQKVRSVVNGRHIEVVDTPGLFDTTLSHEEVNEELVRCMSLLAPGPHVFLLVLQIGRFTQEEKDTQRLIKHVFGEKVRDFTMILFTRGDSLEHEGRSLEDYIKDNNDDSFKKLLSDCGNRVHVFNNYSKDRTQVDELLTKIDSMVAQTGRSFFTNEILQEAEAAIKRKVEKILKEKEDEMKKEREKLEQKHEEEVKEMKRKMQEQRSAIEAERKVIEERLKEKEESLCREREEREKKELIRTEKEKAKREQEEIEKQQWKNKQEELERKIEIDSKEKKSIDEQLMKSREEMRKEKQTWEEERKKWWDERSKEEEEKQQERQKLKQLQEEYDREREEFEKKKEDDKIRREKEEQERKEQEKDFQKQTEQLKTKYENEARKQAEEFNEIIEQYTRDIEAFKTQKEEEGRKQAEEFNEIRDSHTDLKTQYENQIKKVEELKNKHYQEMEELKKRQQEECKRLREQIKCTIL